MPVDIHSRLVGNVVCLYPEGNLKGITIGPIKAAVTKFMQDDHRNFIINLKSVINMDAPAANALNSVQLEIKRGDGRLILTNPGKDIIPWLEKYSPNIPVLNSEEIAIEKLSGKISKSIDGIIAVSGASDIASALFKGASNYKGMVFHFFDDPEMSADKIIELNPKAIILNIESGPATIAAIRKFRFATATKKCPIILFGPASVKSDVPGLIREGANDFAEVKFSNAEVLAYLKPLDFRNVLARKLDMAIEGEYKNFDSKY